MIQAVTDRNFDHVIERSGKPVLVEFWQPGCRSCRALMKQLEAFTQAVAGQVLIVTMNVEENYQIPAELEITSLLALALYRQGRFDRFIGGIGTKEEILKQLALT